MHAVGKLLHAKPQAESTFDAEKVLDTCEFDENTVVAFLQHNFVSGTRRAVWAAVYGLCDS